MLAANDGATSDSMIADNSSGSDETVNHAKLKQKVAESYGQHTSSGAPSNPTVSPGVFVGFLPAQHVGSTVSLIFRRQADVSLSFTNPFLDGILRPPIA